jgi:uncharacterized lipoprotein NlpE involved in copper resistance
MKNLILSTIAMVFVLVSCNKKNKEVETAPMVEQDSILIKKDGTEVVKDSTATNKVYACPMHPESQGKLNDKCPKCGMKLTVEVK